ILQIANTTQRGGTELLAGRGQATSDGIHYASIRNPMFVGDGSQDDFELSNPYMVHYSTAAQIVSQEMQPRSFQRVHAEEWFTWDFSDNLFLVSRLDGFNHDDAKDLVDRGAASDGTFPTSPILCMEAADSARGARDPECHFTIQHLESAGFPAEWITPFDGELRGESLSGLMTGTTSIQDGLDDHDWSPGAFVCNLTSYGAVPQNFWCSEDGSLCPESELQTSIARFVRSGATGVHGTTNEPLNNSFVGAGLFLLQTFGYGMAESAMFTQRYLYWQNILLGDPLASPWAERPQVSIDATNDHPANQPLSINATHPDGIAEVRLYVDGVRVSDSADHTLTYSDAGVPGQSIELLAVAIANNGNRERLGWPAPNQQPRPDVQGWTSLRITLGPDVMEDTGLDTPEEDSGIGSDEKAGCGCSTHSTAGTWWVVLLSLFATVRRRSGQAQTAPNTMSSPSP
ncbi:MAG: MYXO-CTERM sorting domain-containing protein, partial [Myxococcota bacterium]